MSTRLSSHTLKRSRLLGHSELLWHVMSKTGNGYRRDSLRNTGKGTDRRADKLGDTCEVIFETKLQRKARLGQIGIRK